MIGEYVEDTTTGELLGKATMESNGYVWVKPAMGPGHFVEQETLRVADPLLSVCHGVLKWIETNWEKG